VLLDLKRFEDIDDLKGCFELLSEICLTQGKKAGMYRKPVNGAIDWTDLAFYGKPNRYTINKHPEKPKKDDALSCYRFATFDIVDNKERFCLKAIPVNQMNNSPHEILRELLDDAKSRIKIKRIDLDRGFFNSPCIKYLNNQRILYLMPVIQNKRIKKIIDRVPTPYVIEDFPFKDTKFNMIVLKGQNGEKSAFATNEKYSKDDPFLEEKIAVRYRKRMKIEFGYRSESAMRPRTTSNNYMIRVIYFLFSCLLYNLWMIADYIICIFLYGRKKSKPDTIAKNFLYFLSKTDFG
jgi:putative transposase